MRYVAFVSQRDAAGLSAAFDSFLSRSARAWTVRRFQGLAIAYSPHDAKVTPAHSLHEDGGIVIGTVFRRSDAAGPNPVSATFDAKETDRILGTGTRHLVDNYWGGYVAFGVDKSARACYVLRDPTAQVRCYRTRLGTMEIIFSHIEDCVSTIPVSHSVNLKFIVATLLTGRGAWRECGVSGIADVLGGECLRITENGIDSTQVWNPANFCERESIEYPDEAARRLHETVHEVVNQTAARFGRIALSLSGGLDSSIVAGCLGTSDHRSKVVCLNHFVTTRSPSESIVVPGLSKEALARLSRTAGHADEREFARLVCRMWNYPLIERHRQGHDIDLAHWASTPLCASPSPYLGGMDLDQAEHAMVMEHDCDALFSGYGGDSVFQATSHPIAALDYAHRHGVRRGLMGQIASSCSLSHESLWSVVEKTVQYGLLGREMPSNYDLLARPHLLAAGMAGQITREYLRHPWTEQLDGLPPGKKLHVLGIAHACGCYNIETRRERHAVTVNPLLALPILELCLRIPSYVLLFGGVSRGLARRAFAKLLPPPIRQRTMKGTASAFYQQVLLRNMKLVRELLLGGLLDDAGVFDRGKLEGYLRNDQPFNSVLAPQIWIYLGAETWLRQWSMISSGACESKH